MPLDRSYEYYRFYWYKKFAWFPHTCDKSGKRIWLKSGMRGVKMITGPGEPVFIYKWLDSKQFLLERLKGTV